MRIIVNRRPGRCAACRADVPAGEGFAALNGRWLVYHNSTQCLPEEIQRHVAEVNKPARRELTADGFVFTPREPHNLPLMRSFPGARFRRPDDGRQPTVSAFCWQVSLDATDRRRVLEIADQLKLDVAPSLREWTKPAHVVRQCEAAADRGAYDFQVEGVEFLASRNVSILGDDMGLGKTVQALLALPAIDKGFGALVVCPASLKYNWQAEARRWAPSYAPMVLVGKKSFRLPKPGELLICNPEILPAWLKPTQVPGGQKWDTEVVLTDEQAVLAATTVLIADEIHLYKNHKAARSQKMAGLVRIVAQAIGMTGTPFLGRPFDLWGTLSSFGLAFEVFGSFNHFLRLFHGYKDRWGGWHFGEPSPEVAERLRRVMLRRNKAKVLPDLPPKTRQDIPVQITSHLIELLDEIGEDFSDELMEGILSAPLFERMSQVRALLAEASLPAAMPIIEGYEDAEEPLVVFSAHRAPVLALGKREGWASILGGVSAQERQAIVEKFQAGELKGIAMTIQAGGVGLTLTKASNMLFIDQDWTPGNNFQAEDRICRIGQTASSVLIQRLVPDHPLTQRVAELVQWKIDMIEASIEARAEGGPGEDQVCALPAIKDESAEEYEARARVFREAEEAAERRLAEQKVKRWWANQPEATEEPPEPLSENVLDACECALRYMLSVCDGAERKDGRGFNKPDAARMHWVDVLYWRQTPEAQHLLLSTLRAYPRQLRDTYPQLWA